MDSGEAVIGVEDAAAPRLGHKHATRVELLVLVRVRVRAFCSLGFSFTEYTHAACGVCVCVRERERERVDAVFDLVPLDEALRWSLGLGLAVLS